MNLLYMWNFQNSPPCGVQGRSGHREKCEQDLEDAGEAWPFYALKVEQGRCGAAHARLLAWGSRWAHSSSSCWIRCVWLGAQATGSRKSLVVRAVPVCPSSPPVRVYLPSRACPAEPQRQHLTQTTEPAPPAQEP